MREIRRGRTHEDKRLYAARDVEDKEKKRLLKKKPDGETYFTSKSFHTHIPLKKKFLVSPEDRDVS